MGKKTLTNAHCLLERHQCMLSVRPERVIELLATILQ
jgi:hypothetical protein